MKCVFMTAFVSIVFLASGCQASHDNGSETASLGSAPDSLPAYTLSATVSESEFKPENVAATLMQAARNTAGSPSHIVFVAELRANFATFTAGTLADHMTSEDGDYKVDLYKIATTGGYGATVKVPGLYSYNFGCDQSRGTGGSPDGFTLTCKVTSRVSPLHPAVGVSN